MRSVYLYAMSVISRCFSSNQFRNGRIRHHSSRKNKANFLPRCNVIGFAENNKLAGLYLVAVQTAGGLKFYAPVSAPPCESCKCTSTRFQRASRCFNHPPTDNRWRPRSLGELKKLFDPRLWPANDPSCCS